MVILMSRILTIDKEFRDLLPSLTVDEKSQLRQQIESDGCTDPIITWANHEDTIVDGHNRYDICTTIDRSFKTKSLIFETRDQVKAWILKRQGGRRNITNEKLKYIRGSAYNQRKCSHGNANGEARKSGKKVLKDQCDLLETTAAVMAKEYGVGEATIKRNGMFAESLDKLTAAQRNVILNGTRKELPKDNEKSYAEEILQRLKDGPAIKENLLAITTKPVARISDLRAKGHNIVCVGDLFKLEPGKHKKKTQQLPKQFRYDKPEGTDAAVARMKEIVKECNKISKGTRFQVNHEKIIRFVRELGEIVQCFQAGKK